MTIRIDALNSTVNPDRDHEFAAMRDGQTVKLRLEQVLAVGGESDPQALKDLSNVDPATGRAAIDVNAANTPIEDIPPLGLDPADLNIQKAIEVVSGALGGGLRNLLINALGTINQRGYSSGAATSGSNEYTVDRWRVVTSGQSLSWTESEGVRTFTAPAGGFEQVIEGAAILTGDYVLNWEGTATATVNGTPRAKGESFTLTGGANATVRFIDGTVSKMQLEPGTVFTQFERRHPAVELAMCQRYYFRTTNRIRTAAQNNSGAVPGSTQRIFSMLWPVTMRASPSITITESASVTNESVEGFPTHISYFARVSSADGNLDITTLTANAEL